MTIIRSYKNFLNILKLKLKELIKIILSSKNFFLIKKKLKFLYN